MQFAEEHELFRDTIRNFISKEIEPNVDEWENNEKIPICTTYWALTKVKDKQLEDRSISNDQALSFVGNVQFCWIFSQSGSSNTPECCSGIKDDKKPDRRRNI